MKRCPVCNGEGREDRPHAWMLQATCNECGWHYTTRRPGDAVESMHGNDSEGGR